MMPIGKVSRPDWDTVGLCWAIGPMLGIMPLCLMGATSKYFSVATCLVLLIGAYVVGSIPALIGGVFYSTLRAGLSPWSSLAAGALCGFLAGKLCELAVMSGHLSDDISLTDIVWPNILSAPGAIAGLLCALMLLAEDRGNESANPETA